MLYTLFFKSSNASAVEVLRAKISVMPFKFALKQLRNKKKRARRPPVPTKPLTAHYMGGHIYPLHEGKPVLRVCARRGDSHRHKIPYKDKKDKEKQWHLACSIIETDPRPVME